MTDGVFPEDRIVTPGDVRYPLLRSTYTSVNSPHRVLLAGSTEDVVAAIAAARAIGDPIAVRSGGHSLSGMSSIDAGTVIDLSRMRRVEVVDRARRVVHVQPGARWGQVAASLAPFGLAISSGNYGNVGVGGLATAGGIGWLVRQHGLTIDHLIGATIVLPDGRVVETSEHEEPDLFWGVRGAGGQLGIVTEFRFRAEEVRDVGYLRIQARLGTDDHALVRFDQIMRSAPPELTAEVQVIGARANISAVFNGTDEDAARAAVEPLLTIGRARTAGLQFVPYHALVPAAHEHPNVGQQEAVSHNGMVDTVTEDVERHLLAAARAGFMTQVRSLGGAMARVPADATAFANRSQSALVIGTAFDRHDVPALDRHWARIEPHFTGIYGNFEATPSADRVRLIYPGDALERVRELKRRYNPDDVFRAWPLG